MYFLDLPLVRHLLSSWQPAWQPKLFDPVTFSSWRYETLSQKIQFDFTFMMYWRLKNSFEIFLNVSSTFAKFSDKKLSLKGLKPATSCVRDQGATTVPARHIWETGSLHWPQRMPQWFVRFTEFAGITEFNESSAPFRENSIMFSFYRTDPRITSRACVRAVTARVMKHSWDFTQYCYMPPYQSISVHATLT